MKSDVGYKPLCGEETAPSHLNWKQKWFCCGSFPRRMYFLVFLSVVVVVWIIVYYKLLHYHFELPEPLRELRKMFGDGEVKKRRGREEETEVINLGTGKPCLKQFQKERNTKVIHIAIVACGERYGDALLSMKSISLLTNFNIYFHIFTDEKHIKDKSFDKVLKSWPAWKQHWMMFSVHNVQYAVTEDKQDWFKQFKPCASQSLFLAKILVDVDALIYIDPDILFLDAPENLWNVFQKFSTSQIAALTDECGKQDKTCQYSNLLPYPYVKPSGVSSSVMLMNLTRMRQLKWEASLINIYSTYKKHLAYGDQDILNIYFESHKTNLYQLKCNWNYRSHFCMNGNTCKEEAVSNGISALHRSGNYGKTNLQLILNVVYGAFQEYRFDDNFKENLLVSIREKLRSLEHSYDPEYCGNIINAILMHITC